MTQDFRIERDTMGELPVPVNAYYGASTQRAVQNFPISELRFPRRLIRAMGLIKRAAAEVNRELGLFEALPLPHVHRSRLAVDRQPLVRELPTGGLVLLVAGGLAYSGGVAFYVWERLRYHHAIWHAFVLAGSVLQYFAVLFYVIPGPPGSAAVTSA